MTEDIDITDPTPTPRHDDASLSPPTCSPRVHPIPRPSLLGSLRRASSKGLPSSPSLSLSTRSSVGVGGVVNVNNVEANSVDRGKGKGRMDGDDEQGQSLQPKGSTSLTKSNAQTLHTPTSHPPLPSSSSTHSPPASVISHTSSNPSTASSASSSTHSASSMQRPLESDIDPRTLLREQLKRNESVRGVSGEGVIHSPTRQHVVRNDSTRSHLNQEYNTPPSPIRQSTTIQSNQTLTHSKNTHTYSTRRYYILSSAGKPVFSSRSGWKSRGEQGDETHQVESEESLNSIVGVIQAIISLYAIDDDKIRYIDAGRLRIAFLLKSPLYLVAVSDWGEPESVLRTHLDYLFLQTISVVTLSQLQNIFSRRNNYDLRRLLDGADSFLHGIVHRMQYDFEGQMLALSVLPMSAQLREDCAAILKPPIKQQEALYAILVSRTTIITLMRPKTHTVHPQDLHILLNTIDSSTSLQTRHSESWLPICLPRFDNRGFVYAFVSYFGSGNEEEDSEDGVEDDDVRLGLVLITADKEGFFDMKAWKDHVLQKLRKPASGGGASLMTRLSSAYSARLKLYPTVPGVRHYLYRSKTYVQLLQPPAFEGVYADAATDDKKRLVTLYQTIREALHPSRSKVYEGPIAPARLVHIVTDHEAILGMSTTSHELYITLPPLVPKRVATDAATALANFVKRNETNLFLTTAPYF